MISINDKSSNDNIGCCGHSRGIVCNGGGGGGGGGVGSGGGGGVGGGACGSGGGSGRGGVDCSCCGFQESCCRSRSRVACNCVTGEEEPSSWGMLQSIVAVGVVGDGDATAFCFLLERSSLVEISGPGH